MEESECVKRGGHFWNEYDNTGPVDQFGRQDRGFRYAIGKMWTRRKCGLCLKTQELVPAKWVDIAQPGEQGEM